MIGKETVDAVFFDFEGTIVDFQWKLQEAVSETLGALEAQGVQRDHFGRSPGYASLYNKAFELPEAPVIMPLIDAIYDRYDADALERWQLHPDTLEVLKGLKERGYRLALVSNVGASALTAAMDGLGFRGLFEKVISRNETARLKPHPEGLLLAADTMKTDPSRTLFVGDSLNDIHATRAASMKVCYLSGGENTPEEVKKEVPDVTVSRLKELLDTLNP